MVSIWWRKFPKFWEEALYSIYSIIQARSSRVTLTLCLFPQPLSHSIHRSYYFKSFETHSVLSSSCQWFSPAPFDFSHLLSCRLASDIFAAIKPFLHTTPKCRSDLVTPIWQNLYGSTESSVIKSRVLSMIQNIELKKQLQQCYSKFLTHLQRKKFQKLNVSI